MKFIFFYLFLFFIISMFDKKLILCTFVNIYLVHLFNNFSPFQFSILYLYSSISTTLPLSLLYCIYTSHHNCIRVHPLPRFLCLSACVINSRHLCVCVAFFSSILQRNRGPSPPPPAAGVPVEPLVIRQHAQDLHLKPNSRNSKPSFDNDAPPCGGRRIDDAADWSNVPRVMYRRNHRIRAPNQAGQDNTNNNGFVCFLSPSYTFDNGCFQSEQVPPHSHTPE